MRFNVLVACLALAVAVPAQVFIVDAANGAGAHFTDLPAAVASVPDGATLRVRAGVYTPFTLSAKGLRILGEGGVRMTGTPGVVVENTQANQVVLLRDLRLPWLGVQVTDTLGPVILERCERDPTFFLQASDVVALRAANLQLSNCSFDLPPALSNPAGRTSVLATDSSLSLDACRLAGAQGSLGQPGGAGLSLLRSRAVVSRCTLVGGSGGNGCRSCGLPGCALDGGLGGAGCLADGSTLVLLDSSVRGGGGGPLGCCSVTNQCTCSGSGGPGLDLANSAAFVLGLQPIGGAAGAASVGCTPLPGAPIRQTGSNSLQLDPTAQPPLARIDGTQAQGQNISFTVLSPVGSVALMGFAYDGSLMPIEPIGHGSLLTTTAGYIGPFIVPPGNVLQVPWAIPAMFGLGQVYFGQFLTFAGGRIFASNPFVLAVAQ